MFKNLNNKLFACTALALLLINTTAYLIAGNGFNRDLIRKKQVINESIMYRASSGIVLENAYFFNREGLVQDIQSFLERHKKENPDIGICVNLHLKTYDGHQETDVTRCTDGVQWTSLSEASERDQIYNKYELVFQNRKIGSVSWLISNAKQLPWYKEHSIDELYFILMTLFEIVLVGYIIVYLRTRFEVVDTRIDGQNAELLSPPKIKLSPRLKNIEKIIARNRRFFAINEDVIAAIYKHPNAKLFYLNGTTKEIRCSLTELENSFFDHYLRVSRSCIVNKRIISHHGVVRLSKNRVNHELAITIKDRTEVIEVGPKYLETVRDALVKVDAESREVAES